MIGNYWYFIFPLFVLSIQSCNIIDISQIHKSADIIFTGRILSLHQWSIKHHYSAFVWVFRILYGENFLHKHYQSTYVQRPLHVVIDNFKICEENSSLKYNRDKIFGIQIIHARFYSSFIPLPITITNLKTIEGVQKKSSTELGINNTEFISNQSFLDFSSKQSCQYGGYDCEFGATCTENHECICKFNCNTDGKPVQDQITGIFYLNQCQLEQAQCNSYYGQRSALTTATDFTCASTICSFGSKCRTVENDFPKCYCPENCYEYTYNEMQTDKPICGSDNKTYQTLCELNKRACELQENITVAYIGECQNCSNSNCLEHINECHQYQQCSSDYHPLCASNLREYSNECEMNKYACKSKISLTKLHDGLCNFYEHQQQREACKSLICSHGKTCMIEDGIGVCRCLFNCSSEENRVCGSNGFMYRNLCDLEHDSCLREENIIQVESSYCRSTCDPYSCRYGQCKQQYDGRIKCECQTCSSTYSHHDIICGSNGITYSSNCHLEYDACIGHSDITAIHMGPCNNCHNVTCPFYGQCESQQGSYTCVCPSRSTCSAFRDDSSISICASNQQLFSSQCEMNIGSCELQVHLYAISPHYCLNAKDKSEYNRECGYDEPFFDAILNRNTECDTFGRCPTNSYCNTQTNRCCVKVITATLPYRMCSRNEHCGNNMACLGGLCECARQDFIPARNKRECIAVPYLTMGSTCHDSPYGCCSDNLTVSPSVDRRGCPEYCNCNPAGSLQLSCDPVTNACYCRPAVGGSSCSHCENEYWAFSRILTHNNTGCTPCGCHPYGSTRRDCLQDTGECSCHPFATGRQCDQCVNSSLTLTDRGCIDFNKGRRRPRTCRDLTCLFEGVCQIVNGQPRCTCNHVTCTNDEQRSMNICASDGRTYKSKCAIKRQQCIRQYEIGLIYPGVCTALESSSNEYFQVEDDFIAHEIDNTLDYSSQLMPIDSKRCVTNADCGENMVCLSEFCECAKQKYKRIPGPRCVAPNSNILASNYTLNPVRRTTMGACIRRTPCENQATCIDKSDGNYKCLCAFGWQGRHCAEKFEVTIPSFNRQSYFELKTAMSSKTNDNYLLHIDLTFASRNNDGLLLYADDKLTEFYFIVSIRNRTLDITVRLDNFVSTIQLPDTIELDTYARLQIHILPNEIRARLNDGNISSRLLTFGNSFKSILFLGGLPDSLNSLYQQFHLDEGFQGCIHEISINERRLTFNNSEHHIILSAQNIDECIANPCRLGVGSCRNGTHCIPIRNNDANSYRCVCNDYSSMLSTDCISSSMDQCSLKPCNYDQQCINVYPNNYTCICTNCSIDHRYTAEFHSNSYIKRPPLQPVEQTGRFHIEIWFISENSNGLLIYSDHVNSKKGYFAIYLQRRMVICNIIIGSKTISLSSRYPIELNKWHQCSIEIYGQKLTLTVDEEMPVVAYELFSPHTLWPRSFTFIGSLPNQYRLFDTLSSLTIFEGFHGAIQKIILNNRPLIDIRQDSIELFNISEYHGYPCQPNPCSINEICRHTSLNNYTCHKKYEQFRMNDISIELDGNENLIYGYVPLNLNQNYFKLYFKTKYSSGLIFYVGDTITTDVFSQYLSLIIVNGFLQFTIKLDKNSTETFLISKQRIDDEQWHRIEIERFRRRITMKIDDDYPRRSVISGRIIKFHPNPTYIYVGGYYRLCNYDDNHCQMYRGCLKNLYLDKHSIDLINDELSQTNSLKLCQNQTEY